jgi:AcrR family transcriptional regulator
MSRVTDAYLEARHDEIRNAALRVFVRRGLDAATMQEIATEAGISPGAIYRYYASKEQLAQAVFSLCHEQNRELFEQALSGSGSPLAALVAAGRTVWDRFADPQALPQFTLNIEAALSAARRPDALADQLHQLHDRLVGELAELTRAAQANGELAPDLDASGFARMLVACVEGLRLLYVERGGDLDTEGVFEMLRYIVGALAPAGKGE